MGVAILIVIVGAICAIVGNDDKTGATFIAGCVLAAIGSIIGLFSLPTDEND